MHYCCQCGHEIPRREKHCKRCSTQVEYLCALPPIPVEPHQRRDFVSPRSITKWLIFYLFAVIMTFSVSYAYFSSPSIFSWFSRPAKPNEDRPAIQPSPAPPAKAESFAATLKNSFNVLTVGLQKTNALLEDTAKVNVPGDPLKTAANYRTIQRNGDALFAQLTFPPDIPPEVGSVLMPLKECVSLISKSSAIMADYLEGKLSLSPPNPDWVARSQDYMAQARARVKDAQQALGTLRKKIE